MPSKKRRACPKCKGKGYVLKWTTDRHGKRISYEVKCANCDGTGETTAT